MEVEFESTEDAQRAIQATRFTYSIKDANGRRDVTLPLKVETHKTKNSSKGVINCYDLRGVSDEEIVDGLSAYGVTEARRILVRRDERLVATDNIILTFNATDVPTDVKVGYHKVNVRKYVPSPMRCYRCHRFGHTSKYCRNREVCGKCASETHGSDACTSQSPRCVNCREDQVPHTSYDRDCPVYIREKEIIAIKCDKNLSFREAREVYHRTNPAESYATKVKSVVQTNTEAPQSGALTQITVEQFVTLLKSFGLSVGPAPNAPPVVSAPRGGDDPEVGNTARSRDSVAQAAPTAPGGAQRDDEGWIEVGRGGKPRRPPAQAAVEVAAPHSGGAMAPQSSSRPHSPVPADVLERQEAEKRARDAKRARLAEQERVKAINRPSVANEKSNQSVDPHSQRRRVEAPSTSPSGTQGPLAMGPPPPPPPLATPPPVPRHTNPPSAPSRPTKRAMPCQDSPTEGSGNPRARIRFQPSSAGARSSSADGRLHGGNAQAEGRFPK